MKARCTAWSKFVLLTKIDSNLKILILLSCCNVLKSGSVEESEGSKEASMETQKPWRSE